MRNRALPCARFSDVADTVFFSLTVICSVDIGGSPRSTGMVPDGITRGARDSGCTAAPRYMSMSQGNGHAGEAVMPKVAMENIAALQLPRSQLEMAEFTLYFLTTTTPTIPAFS